MHFVNQHMFKPCIQPSHHVLTSVIQHLNRCIGHTAKIRDATVAQQHNQVHRSLSQHGERGLQHRRVVFDCAAGGQVPCLAQRTQKYGLIDQLVKQRLHTLLRVCACLCTDVCEVFIVVLRKARCLVHAARFAQLAGAREQHQ